jgi:hypothetical protein
MAEKIALSDDIKKALTGLAPFSPDKLFDFTPDHYLNEKRALPKEVIPVYQIRVFTKSEQDTVLAEFNKDDKDGGKLYDITRKSVMGWRNVVDIAAEEMIEYKSAIDKGADDSVFSRITRNDRDAIFSRILAVSGLVRADKLGFGY